MSAGLSEKFSENRRRGRPKVISGAMVGIVNFAASDPDATPRTLQNKFYQLQAIHALSLGKEDMPEAFRFLWDANEATQTFRGRWTILAELGRIADENDMRAVAHKVCEMKPRARDAVAMIRRARIGESKAGDTLQLANELIETINDYRVRHPATAPHDLLIALEAARQAVEGTQ